MAREHGAEHASQWAAINSIAAKLGCPTETLRRWVRQAERDAGERPGLTADERQLAGARARECYVPPAEYEAEYYAQAAVA